MPRKAYLADLQTAKTTRRSDSVRNIQAGSDDGEFMFTVIPAGSKQHYLITALISDVSDYPSSHEYMMFCPDNAPKALSDAIQRLSGTRGKTVPELLDLTARKIAVKDKDGDMLMLDSQLDADGEPESEDEEQDFFPPSDDDTDIQPARKDSLHSTVGTKVAQSPASTVFRRRIRADLKVTKEAGFKIGHLGMLLDNGSCYVTVSCRVAKLGLSPEAMQAWQVQPNDYLTLLIHYPNGYKSMETIQGYDATTARKNIELRVGLNSTYKPTLQEAVKMFTKLSREQEKAQEANSQSEAVQEGGPQGLRNTFISRPLNELLNARLTTLIGYRSLGMGWTGAESFYNDHQGKSYALHDAIDDHYMAPEPHNTTLPNLVTADHILDSPTAAPLSFPLIAIQFFLRHFARCTEFCLVCHCKLQDEFEALKPYVCDKPLCLYQYMSLGFGPSIEHEILAQPQVVDLLISFCYASASGGRLKEFPDGLGLTIPYHSTFFNLPMAGKDSGAYYLNRGQEPTTLVPSQPSVMYEARLDEVKLEVVFDNGAAACPVKVGDWIIGQYVQAQQIAATNHYRVAETIYYPTIKLSEPIMLASGEQDGYATPNTPTAAARPAALGGLVPFKFTKYDRNFDDLTESAKREVILQLLQTLPGVEEMKQYLIRRAPSDLNSWSERISTAALGVLRWIVASNRACIMQVDELPGNNDMGPKKEDRLFGMPGYMQFRFAMGAPDKERRFLSAVKDATQRLNLTYPTIFAWHGSPLANWHSIIREGLHFKETHHGRAYGHGVYHSLDHNTSAGYGFGHNVSYWPKSALKISAAMALSEIVNAPKEFTSMSPHLVVQYIEWIQTRYLFVKCTITNQDPSAEVYAKDTKPVNAHPQDPHYTPRGPGGQIEIPATAVAKSRRVVPKPTSPKIVKKADNKRFKASGNSWSDPITLDEDDVFLKDIDDAASVATDVEDLEILFDEPEPQPEPVHAPSLSQISGSSQSQKAGGIFGSITSALTTKAKPMTPQTDFIPGTLDFTTLPTLAPPSWATIGATKRLQKDFKAMLATQDATPAHELGWYIDPEKIENMYQWILELHSFEPHLPLAKDMKSRGIKSVVLELRFGKDYPMSPPFVRIIRPRFLSFQQGGGGHVTAGGALCMELLTNNGWSAVSSIESVLLQVRLAMSSTDPKPARLDMGKGMGDYGVGEAVEAYIRACQVHGWTVPDGFRQMAYGGEPDVGGAY